MSRSPNPNKLLVEGVTECRVIPEFVEANGVAWGESKEEAIVLIRQCDGVEGLLKPGVIQAELKSSRLKRLGILLDADDQLENRWNSLRQRCSNAFDSLPESFPAEGLIAENEQGIRLGVWFMPDNASHGMLETFLSYLVPAASSSAWEYSQKCVEESLQHGATYKEAHFDKASVYTWLAWQDPPGRQLHQALTERIFDPTVEYAKPFLHWFRELYEL